MTAIALEGVTKRFGTVEAVRGIDLDVPHGEFVVFVGPSGCGKSTLLRMIAGLEDVSGGAIYLGGRDVTRVDPRKRGTAMVFQSYALYPHMTVAGNLGFPLEMAGLSKPDIKARVAETARTLHIEPLLARYPRELSGGQRQRVAIGRAIVREPDVFLFDEPLSNLDAELRGTMRLEILRLHAELGATMVFVTHDQVEAMTLADRIVVLRDGRIEQVGRPIDVYRDPDTVFVAGFIGAPKINLLKVETNAGGNAARLGDMEVPLDHLDASLPQAAPLTLGLRPEHLRPDSSPSDRAPSAGTQRLGASVDLVELLGSTSLVHARLGAGETIVAEWPTTARIPAAGDRVSLSFDPQTVLVFDADGRRLR